MTVLKLVRVHSPVVVWSSWPVWTLALVASACGRLGFDPQCVAGDACTLPGLCLSGTMVCAPQPYCNATDPLPQGASCAAGTCDAGGICVGSNAATLVASPRTMSEEFGTSVALDVDRLAIGVPQATIGGTINVGRVEVWERSSGIWSPVATLLASDGGIDRNFGTAVALQGDTVFVANGSISPAVYVFQDVGGSWTQTDKLVVPGSMSLGTSIAIDGDRAIIGDAFTQIATPGGTSYGSGRIFERDGTGVWVLVTTLASAAADTLGASVALVGDRAVVGSLWEKNGQGLECGAAHVFDRAVDGAWNETVALQPPPDDATISYDASGASVALDGKRVLAGSPFTNVDSPALDGAGALLSYEGATTTVNLESPPQQYSQLGTSISAAGERAVATLTPISTTLDGQLDVFRFFGDGTWHQVARLITPGAGRWAHPWNGAGADVQVSMSGDTAVVGYYDLDSYGGVVVYDLTGL